MRGTLAQYREKRNRQRAAMTAIGKEQKSCAHLWKLSANGMYEFCVDCGFFKATRR